MSAKTESVQPAKRYLTDDSVEAFRSADGHHYLFRIRIWRAKDTTPVVLVSQIPGGITPALMVGKIANWVFAAVLGYPKDGMFYFEDSIPFKGRRRELVNVQFETYLKNCRTLMMVDERYRANWDVLEEALSEKFER